MQLLENKVARVIIAMVGVVLGWNIITYISSTFIYHQPYVCDPIMCIVIPAVVGALVATPWKD